MNYEQAKAKAEKYGQEQVLKYVDVLSDAEKQVLFDQIEATDMEMIESFLSLPDSELDRKSVV